MKKKLFLIFAIIPMLVGCGNKPAPSPDPSTILVSDIVLYDQTIELYEEDFATISFYILPANATNKKVTWKSNDQSVATINNGYVTGIAKGNTDIIISSVDGGATSTCHIVVKDKEPEDERIALLNTFKNNIRGFEGQVKEATLTNATATIYGGLGMITGYNCTKTRYTDISETRGRYAFLNEDGSEISSYNYVEQISYNERFFYHITVTEDEKPETDPNTIPFRKEDIDSVLSIGCTAAEYNSIVFLLNVINQKDYAIRFDNLDGFVNDGTWEYSYGYTEFEIDTDIPKTIADVECVATIKDGIITNFSQHSDTILFAGGVAVNEQEIYTEAIYKQGEFEQFSGVRFKPSI